MCIFPIVQMERFRRSFPSSLKLVVPNDDFYGAVVLSNSDRAATLCFLPIAKLVSVTFPLRAKADIQKARAKALRENNWKFELEPRSAKREPFGCLLLLAKVTYLSVFPNRHHEIASRMVDLPLPLSPTINDRLLVFNLVKSMVEFLTLRKSTMVIEVMESWNFFRGTLLSSKKERM